jgi:aminoglycoside phosphotransferase (APT) family kinase protein
MEPTIAAVARSFAVDGELTACEPFAGGHINDSYRLTWRTERGSARYLLQRVNPAVFRDPVSLMENISRVTMHMRARLEARNEPDIDRRGLRFVLTRDGVFLYRDRSGACWRLCRFIEHARVYATVRSPKHAEQAGRAFGEFQHLLADLPSPRLHETIPDFHTTPLRFSALDHAIAADACGRVALAQTEIDSVLARRSLATVLLDLQQAGAIPERIVHNDAKLSNVLLDAATGQALCVVDLDTIMPGLSLYDFGDMVRTMTSPTAEDERDLSLVEVQPPLFAALAGGYLATAGPFLNPVERAHLVTAGQLITLEQAVRFLTDYLSGDTYYKTQRPGQNLDRCRTQLKLVDSLERQDAVLRRVAE